VPTTYLKSPQGSSETGAEVPARVAEMLRTIESEGLPAIRRFSRELDAWDPPSFVVSAAEVERAAEQLSPQLRKHIASAQRRVAAFARAQRETLRPLDTTLEPGVTLGHRHVPVDRVGAYVPGGRYPMLASSFMTVLVAKVAGVRHVVACAPPQAGKGVHSGMLYAMHTSGADVIVCLGGVQALAALAFGLIEEVGEVDMLVGAGNAYVAEAKRQLYGRVGIDLLAGPTEVLVIADDTADPDLVAADLLGQAEHGPTSPAGLIAIGEPTGRRTLAALERLLATWPTAEVAGSAWRTHGWAAVVENDGDAIALANEVAMEHVEVQVAPARLDRYLDELHNYGSLFLGEQATVAYGDKAVGTNHVLPTVGAARYTGGLWVGKFLKTVTYQRLTEQGTRAIAPDTAAISQAESFAGHALTAMMRLERAGGRP
jgi:sulfopropanediol 3-dehydrogenase